MPTISEGKTNNPKGFNQYKRGVSGRKPGRSKPAPSPLVPRTTKRLTLAQVAKKHAESILNWSRGRGRGQSVYNKMRMGLDAAFESFLKDAPRFAGLAHRGMAVTPDVRKRLISGKVMVVGRHSSASSEARVAERWAYHTSDQLVSRKPEEQAKAEAMEGRKFRTDQIVLCIKTHSGVDMRNLARDKTQKEVIIPKGTRLKVLKVTAGKSNTTSDGKPWIVELEEVPNNIQESNPQGYNQYKKAPTLYHGTGGHSLDSIRQQGLRAMEPEWKKTKTGRVYFTDQKKAALHHAIKSAKARADSLGIPRKEWGSLTASVITVKDGHRIGAQPSPKNSIGLENINGNTWGIPEPVPLSHAHSIEHYRLSDITLSDQGYIVGEPTPFKVERTKKRKSKLQESNPKGFNQYRRGTSGQLPLPRQAKLQESNPTGRNQYTGRGRHAPPPLKSSTIRLPNKLTGKTAVTLLADGSPSEVAALSKKGYLRGIVKLNQKAKGPQHLFWKMGEAMHGDVVQGLKLKPADYGYIVHPHPDEEPSLSVGAHLKSNPYMPGIFHALGRPTGLTVRQSMRQRLLTRAGLQEANPKGFNQYKRGPRHAVEPGDKPHPSSYVKVYHGSTQQAVKRILKEGLKAKDPHVLKYDDTPQPKGVYVCTDGRIAATWAKDTVRKHGGDPDSDYVIFEAEVPRHTLEHDPGVIINDEQYYSSRDIPPSALRRVFRTKQTKGWPPRPKVGWVTITNGNLEEESVETVLIYAPIVAIPQLQESNPNHDAAGRFARGPGSGSGLHPHAANPRVFKRPADLITYENWGKPQTEWRDPKTGERTGRLLTGRVVEHKDLPKVLYHTSVAVGAVRKSGVLLGAQGGGLGGGTDNGVSFTTSRSDAHLIARELKRAVKLRQGQITMDSFQKLVAEDEKRGGLKPGELQKAYDQIHWWYTTTLGFDKHSDKRDDPDFKADLMRQGYNQYLFARESTAEKLPHAKMEHLKNPILFTDEKFEKTADPKQIGVIAVHKNNIPKEALITSGSDDFLHEVRVYADVPHRRRLREHLQEGHLGKGGKWVSWSSLPKDPLQIQAYAKGLGLHPGQLTDKHYAFLAKHKTAKEALHALKKKSPKSLAAFKKTPHSATSSDDDQPRDERGRWAKIEGAHVYIPSGYDQKDLAAIAPKSTPAESPVKGLLDDLEKSDPYKKSKASKVKNKIDVNKSLAKALSKGMSKTELVEASNFLENFQYGRSGDPARNISAIVVDAWAESVGDSIISNALGLVVGERFKQKGKSRMRDRYEKLKRENAVGGWDEHDDKHYQEVDSHAEELADAEVYGENKYSKRAVKQLKKMGLPTTSEGVYAYLKDYAKRKKAEAKKLGNAGPLEHPATYKALRIIRDTIYSQTQATLKKQGIKTLTVVRGTSAPASDKKLGKGVIKYGGAVVLKKSDSNLKEVSSFSSSQSIADGFNSGLSIYMRVPAKDVFSTALTGVGCTGEKEVVVIGRPKQASLFVLGYAPEEMFESLFDEPDFDAIPELPDDYDLDPESEWDWIKKVGKDIPTPVQESLDPLQEGYTSIDLEEAGKKLRRIWIRWPEGTPGGKGGRFAPLGAPTSIGLKTKDAPKTGGRAPAGGYAGWRTGGGSVMHPVTFSPPYPMPIKKPNPAWAKMKHSGQLDPKLQETARYKAAKKKQSKIDKAHKVKMDEWKAACEKQGGVWKLPDGRFIPYDHAPAVMGKIKPTSRDVHIGLDPNGDRIAQAHNDDALGRPKPAWDFAQGQGARDHLAVTKLAATALILKHQEELEATWSADASRGLPYAGKHPQDLEWDEMHEFYTGEAASMLRLCNSTGLRPGNEESAGGKEKILTEYELGKDGKPLLINGKKVAKIDPETGKPRRSRQIVHTYGATTLQKRHVFKGPPAPKSGSGTANGMTWDANHKPPAWSYQQEGDADGKVTVHVAPGQVYIKMQTLKSAKENVHPITEPELQAEVWDRAQTARHPKSYLYHEANRERIRYAPNNDTDGPKAMSRAGIKSPKAPVSKSQAAPLLKQLREAAAANTGDDADPNKLRKVGDELLFRKHQTGGAYYLPRQKSGKKRTGPEMIVYVNKDGTLEYDQLVKPNGPKDLVDYFRGTLHAAGADPKDTKEVYVKNIRTARGTRAAIDSFQKGCKELLGGRPPKTQAESDKVQKFMYTASAKVLKNTPNESAQSYVQWRLPAITTLFPPGTTFPPPKGEKKKKDEGDKSKAKGNSKRGAK